MDEEITKLQLRKIKLLQAIEDTKKRKEKIILIVQGIEKEFSFGKLKRDEYEGRLRSALKNRTAEQWIKYYDDYIEYYGYQIKLCEKLINEGKRKTKEKITVYGGWEGKKRKTKLTPILIVLISIVLIAMIIFLFVGLKLIGVQGFSDIKTKISSVFEAAGEEIDISGAGLSDGRGRGGGRIVERVQEIPAEGIYEIQIEQYQAVVGQPVKWKKQFTIDGVTEFSVELPIGSENIQVKSSGRDITDLVDINKKRRFFLFKEKEVEVKLSKKSITGNAVVDNQEQEFEIIYETPAPEIEVIQEGIKTNIKITGPDDVHYQDVFSFVDIPEVLKIGEEDKLKLYQTKQDGIENKKQIPITPYDTDENGLYDKVEWTTSGLSDWEGYLIIEISKAEHLNLTKGFISDIYDGVYQLDDVWSETINGNEYVKITFEKKLSNVNDITIYPRVVSGNPRIEVYESEGSEKIAEFVDIIDNEYNKIYLTNLQAYQDVFDLKVVEGSLEFNHIIDPDWVNHPDLDSWSNKKRIEITSSSAQTNYQVKLAVTYATGMQADFDDLRFTTASQSGDLLDYWIEDKSNGVSAEVWVEVPSLISGVTSIYMYYENAGASAYTNIDNTFLANGDYLNPLWRNSLGGGAHSCAVTSSGTVKCWGSNTYGQAPIGIVPGISNAIAVGTGIEHSCAVISDGTVKCWGRNQFGQVGRSGCISCGVGNVVNVNNAISIALGDIHSCALLSTGDVMCWGENYWGQSGPNCDNGCNQVVGGPGCCEGPDGSLGLSNVIDLSAGALHSCTVISDGSVKCWGDAYDYVSAGQNCANNGDGCTGADWPGSGCCETPMTLTEMSGYTIKGISLGYASSNFLTNAGDVRCWVSWINYPAFNYGQCLANQALGNGIVVSSGADFICSLRNNGQVSCWGKNNLGQLGRSCGSQCTIGYVTGLTNVVDLASGNDHSCALIKDGSVKCWGNGYGDTPVLISSATYQLGGRFDKDDQLTDTTTSLDLPNFGIDDFFVRKYVSAEPSSSFIFGLHECGVGADCPVTDYCMVGAFSTCEPIPICKVRNEASTGYINALSTTDPGDRCAPFYDSCDDLNTKRGGDGFCDGSGACDINDATVTVGLGKVCRAGADVVPSALSNCGAAGAQGCSCAIWNNCINDACYADRYYTGFSGESCTSSGWVDIGSNYDVPNDFRISATSQGTSCTTSNVGHSASYTSCSNSYTRIGPDGYCDSSGSLDTDDASLHVLLGYVCQNGNNVNPSSSIYCDRTVNCIDNDCNAPRYYRGYAASGSSCSETNKQAYGDWFAPINTAINQVTYYGVGTSCTTDALGCSDTDHCSVNDLFSGYRCNGVGSCNEDFSLLQTCGTDATETDDTQDIYAFGTCTDNIGCSGTSCQFTSDDDSCGVGNVLTQYLVSGFSCISAATYDCDNLDVAASDTDLGDFPLVAGTCTALTDGSCGAGICSTSSGTGGGADSCSSTTQLTEQYLSGNNCLTTSYDCSSFEVLATGDIANDPLTIGSCTGGTSAGCSAGAFSTTSQGNIVEGCIDSGDCPGGANCLFREAAARDSGDACTGADECYVVQNYDPDTNSNTCGSCLGSGAFNIGGIANCCGDDDNENDMTSLFDDSMDGSSDGSDACCVKSTNCVNADICYPSGTTSLDLDADGDKDYCSSGIWYDCTTNSECQSGEICDGEDCVDALAPLIDFTDPTPENGTRSNNFIPINVSASDIGRGEDNISLFIDFDNSLVGWWRMGDTTCAVDVCDDSSYDNVGTIVGDVFPTNGRLGNAFDFDGVEDYVSVGTDEILALSTPRFTITAWIKRDTEKISQEFIVSKDSKALRGFGFEVYKNKLCYERDGVWAISDGTTILNKDIWWFVAISYNGTAYTTFINAFMDNSTTSVITNPANAVSDFRIGARIYLGFEGYFEGSIDDVMIFNRSLSADEIKGLYANTSSKYLFNNFINLEDGNYTFKAYAQDAAGNVNMTETREVEIGVDTDPSLIFFKNPTPFNSTRTNDFIPINISASDVGRGENNISTFINFDNSLVGWWRMDDVSGDIVYDDSSYGNDGTIIGATQYPNGKLGYAMGFDGVDDYVRMDSDIYNNVYTEFAISFWINTNTASPMNYGMALHRNDGSSIGSSTWFGGVQITTNNLVATIGAGSGPGWTAGLTGVTAVPGTWYHVVSSWNGTNVKTYVDGVEEKSYALTSLTNKVATTRIGASADSGAYGLNGSVDDVMIFNRSLSADEIKGLYANTSSKYLFNNFINLEDGNYTFKAYAQDAAGNVNMTETREVKIKTNTAPVITSWTLDEGSPTSCGITTINYENNDFRIFITDTDGWQDMEDGGSANVYFEKSGVYRPSGAPSTPASCTYSGNDGANVAYYTCSIDMNYYDDPDGSWMVYVTATDGDLSAIPQSSIGRNPYYLYFVYLSSLIIRYNEEPVVGSDDDTISWDEILTTSANEAADNHLKVENCGNADISSISITGQDLTGTGDNTDTVEPDSFFVDETSNPCVAGQILNNPPSARVITNTALAKGTGAVVPSENIYFCLKDINHFSGPEPIVVDTYSSSSAWDISASGIIISLIKFIRFNFEFTILFAVGVRIKKKLKNKLKKRKITEDNLLEVFEDKLKERYNIGVEELLKIKEKKVEKKRTEKNIIREIKIPLIIFKKSVSPAEALSKYLKENFDLKFSEIAKLLNRDERTIWASYNNAVKKEKEKTSEKIKKHKTFEKIIFVSINIFSNRRLSILESVVKYLKDRGYRNIEIAELLGKDQRNIYTIYKRVEDKLK